MDTIPRSPNARDDSSVWSKLVARFRKSPVGMRLAKGLVWSIWGTATSRALTIAAGVLLARILGQLRYGEFGVIQSTVNMFTVLAGLGLGLTATKYVAEFRRTDPQRAGRVIGFSTIVAVVSGGMMALAMVIAAPWLAAGPLAKPHLTGPLRIAGLMLFLQAVQGAQTGAFFGLEAFRRQAHALLATSALALPILVVGAYVGGLVGAVWASVVSLAVGWLVNQVVLSQELAQQKVPWTVAASQDETLMLWRFTLPAVLSSLLVVPIHWLCMVLLVNTPSGYEQMAIYNAASPWYALAMAFPSQLAQVALPVFTDQVAVGNTRQSVRTLLATLGASAAFVLPLVAVGSLVSPLIMELYGSSFREGWPTLVVMLLTAAVTATHTAVGQVLVASGRMWIALAMNLGWAILFVGFTLWFRSWGAVGLASARLAAYLVHTLWVMGFVYHLLSRAAARPGHSVPPPGPSP